MAGVPMANGHRPAGLLQLLHPSLATAPRPDRDTLAYDLDLALAAVVGLHADVDEHCSTASTLRPEREGAGIVIDENGLILTVGYIIVEARDVTITILGRAEPVAGEVIAYDHETGLGMVRAVDALDIAPLALGSARNLVVGDPVVISGYGGFEQAIAASVVARQEFSGSWEHMLDNAVFTTPLHPYWGGAALIGPDGPTARWPVSVRSILKNRSAKTEIAGPATCSCRSMSCFRFSMTWSVPDGFSGRRAPGWASTSPRWKTA